MRLSYFFGLSLALIFFIPITAQQWQALNANTFSWRFEDIYFVDESTGWAVDGGGQVIKTSNGGQSWQQQLYEPDLYFRSVEFVDENTGFAATLGGTSSEAQLFRTVNGGEDWEEITSTMPQSVVGICGMDVVGSSTLFVTGTFWTSAYIMRSDDLGDTWEYMNMSSYANGLVDIEFKNEMEGLAVGQSAQGTGLRAVILGTDDGGDTWEVRSTGTANNQRSWKIQYLTDNIVYASIEEFEPSPQYFKSTDGGENWTLMDVATTQTGGTMQGIGFLNEQIGWIGGWSDLLYETNDGGISWEYMPGLVGSMNRFFRIDHTKMYAGGVNVYCYEDPNATDLIEVSSPDPIGHEISVIGSDIVVQLVNHTFMELSIHDAQGKQIEVINSSRRNIGEHRFEFDRSSLISGVYFVALYTYHGYDSMRIIID